MDNVQESVTARIRQNPKFQTLVERRGRFAWTLATIVLVLFYGFVLIVAFSPSVLGQPLGDGTKVTVGLSVVLFIFVFSWLLTAFYVRRANNEFDGMTKELIEESWREARQ